SLGLSYMLVHNYEKALPTIEEAYRRTTESLGERHPTTIYSMDLLAWVYGAVRPVRETIPLHVEVMARFADVLGEEHLKTHDAIMNAAVAYFENDDETETIRLLESVLPKFRKALGDGHESSIISATYLSEAYLVKDRPQEALTLLESIPEATAEKRVEGRRGLAEALVRTGRVEEGGELLQEVLKSERNEYADQSQELAEAIALAGERYLRGGMPAEAETLLREAHELLQANPMPRESLPLVVQSALGSALAEQGNYEEAETLLLAGVEGLRAERTERPYPLPREIEDAVRRTIRFYEQTDQEDETALWQKILAEQTASEAD
ncbi:MAG: tetratricopeptide repeat protein, partial [Pirellulaceae bacterium]